MLATGRASLLAEWQEYYELEPWGDEWNRESRATASMINEIRMAVPRETPLKPEGLLEDDAFVPKQRKQKKQADKMTPKQGFNVMRQSIGV